MVNSSVNDALAMGRYLRGMILRSLTSMLVFVTLSAVPLSAQDESVSQDDLLSYEERIEQERAALQALETAQKTARTDLNAVNRRLLVAAQESLRREEQAARIERRLIDLEVRERAARQQVLSDREGLKSLIASLISVRRKQPPALATHPDNAKDAIRSAVIMSDLSDLLDERSKRLAEDIEAYTELIADVTAEKAKLEKAETILSANRMEIETLAAVKRAAFEDVSGETETRRRRIAALVERAETVRSLLAELEREAPLAPSRKPPALRLPTAPGSDAPLSVAVLDKLGLPVAGQLITAYGDDLPTGRKSEGMTLRTRTAAQVVAPADAQIAYAGPFRSFGQMLILRTGDGYHIVIYGLADIYGTRGQSVLAGEPIGRMTGRPDVEPELYMELRKDGTPQDPAKWMSQARG